MAPRCELAESVNLVDPVAAGDEVAGPWPQLLVCDYRAVRVVQQHGRPGAQVEYGVRDKARRLPCLPGRKLLIPGPGPVQVAAAGVVRHKKRPAPSRERRCVRLML